MTRILRAVWRTTGLQAAVVLFILAGATPGLADNDSPKAPLEGELQIEGELIQCLTLVGTTGETQTIARPEATLSLPVDQYRIQEIQLSNGYVCFYPATAESLSVTKDQPCKLQAGAPLTPGLTLERSGKIVELDYGMVDAAGRRYSGGESSPDPPRFNVFQGDREIGSGTFEYG